MSAIVNLRVLRNFQQFVSIRPISNYPTTFRKKKKEFRKWMVTFIFSNWRLEVAARL
jgi:hypothetical protein